MHIGLCVTDTLIQLTYVLTASLEQLRKLSIAHIVAPAWMVFKMETKNALEDWLNKHDLVIRICNGAVTFCDGNCEECDDCEDD